MSLLSQGIKDKHLPQQFVKQHPKITISIDAILQGKMKIGRQSTEIVQFLQKNLNEKINNLSASVSIGHQSHINLNIQFKSQQLLSQFTNKADHYQMRIKHHQQNNKKSSIFLDINQLVDFKQFVDQIKKEQSSYYQQKEEKTVCQGQFIYINQKLRKFDIIGLKKQWNEGLLNFLEQLYKNWQIYSQAYYKDMYYFVLSTMYKIYKTTYLLSSSSKQRNTKINIYQLVYPNITSIVQKFRIKLRLDSFQTYIQKEKNGNLLAIRYKNQTPKMQRSQRQILQKLRIDLQIQQTITDKMLTFFVQNKRSQTKQKSSIDLDILNRQMVKIKPFISQCIQFYIGLSYWTDLFASIQSYFTNIIQDNTSNIRKKILKNIQNQRLVQNRCLGCSKFLYYHLNIYDESVNNSRVKVYPSIRKLRQVEIDLKNQICGMLNDSGGIILFDCVKQYRCIYPRGEIMSQKDKQENEQRIISFMKSIYPRIELHSHITISFIPIINYDLGENGKKQRYTGQQCILKQDYTYEKHQYLEGTFVTRIKVVSPDPTRIYYWETPSTINQQFRRFFVLTQQNGLTKQISCRNITKLIKRKMKMYYIQQKYKEEQRIILKNSSSFLEHQCEAPQIGPVNILINNQQQRIQNTNGMTLEDKYKQICLLITLRSNIANVKQHLIKNNIRCQIKFEFENYKFKLCENTAILYYDGRFDDLLIEINKKQYKVNHKSPIIISLASYLYFQKRNRKYPITFQDFENICIIFKEEFPSQFLKIYQFRCNNNEIQYYCQTRSKLSTIFMYFYLNDHQEKTKFKNPPNLEKMNQQQRSKRLIVKYQNFTEDHFYNQNLIIYRHFKQKINEKIKLQHQRGVVLQSKQGIINRSMNVMDLFV